MSENLLPTKLYKPPLRPLLVPRPRLFKTLNTGLNGKLTLVSAPAGFGKTTLVSSWLRPTGKPTAWLSLDAADNDLVRFLTYVIAALQQLNAEIGLSAQELLQSSQLPHPETLLTLLIRDIATLPNQYLLVLDDYHLLNEQAIHSVLDFLIEHLPPTLHLVIISRGQPPLNLSRLRARAQLLEITSADLRFTAVEVEKFLADVMQLDLSAADRTALEMRTEGWIAGLQLAALALQTSRLWLTPEKRSAFIASFGGTDRYIGDYLFEEVFLHQSEELQYFLLATSVVDSLCSSLCDALLIQSGSQAHLEQLDERQLFIIPLDNQRQWYRYHHLFVDLLRHRLSQNYPEQLPQLHQRASLWYAQKNRLAEAIQHSLKAQDFERAADLIETAFQKKDWIHRDMQRLLEWYEALPPGVTQTRSHLKLGIAWLLFEIYSDQWDRIETYLRQVENTLTTPDNQTAFSAKESQQLLAQVDLLRANQARQQGEPARVISLCQQALARLPHDDIYLRSGALAHLAAGYESLGQMAQASQLYSESLAMCRTAQNVDGRLFASARLIQVLSLSGQLQQAEGVFRQTLNYAPDRTGPDMGLPFISMADIYREQNQLEQAQTYLEKGLELCRPFPAWHTAVTIGSISLAQLHQAQGNEQVALNVLDDLAGQSSFSTPFDQKQLASNRARLLLAQGNFNAAARWARECDLTVNDEPNYENEFHYLTLTRILLAQAALQKRKIQSLLIVHKQPLPGSLRLLQRLLTAAQAGERVGRVIEIYWLQALTYGLQQEPTQALRYLEKALSLAEGANYVHLFVAEGWPAYQLLTLLSAKPTASISNEYIKTILAAFPQSIRQSRQTELLPQNALTKRELKTLQLLASDLSFEAIAHEMSVSLSTVRTYAKRIYSKLAVHSRAEAVYQAKERKLL